MAGMKGRRIAVLATDGVEEIELTRPIEALRDAGAEVALVSLKTGRIQAMESDVNASGTYEVAVAIAAAAAGGVAGLVVPGGAPHPAKLRLDARAVAFVRAFVEAGKPIAAICHGPWMLIEAGGVSGRTLTSWPSLRTDLRNAGATWVDETVVTDGRLVTSRKPDDLPAFCDAMLALFGRAA